MIPLWGIPPGSIRSPAAFETGIVGRVSLSGGEVTGLGWTPLSVQYDPSRVVPTDDNLDDSNFSEESERLNSHLGAAWRLP